MANDSLIRKIPLLGNCDLTNFHADIHDYEGFEKDNSLFLNKRKVNWWKRYTGEGEIGGGLRGEVNGDYFDVYKDNSLIGKISRQYYKKESVSSTAWQSETLTKVVNPYPEDNNYIGVLPQKIITGSTKYNFIRKVGNYYAVRNGAGVDFYNLAGSFIKRIAAPLTTSLNTQIYIAEDDVTFTTTAEKTTVIFSGFAEVKVELSLKKDDVLIFSYYEGMEMGQWGGGVTRGSLGDNFQGSFKLYADDALWDDLTINPYNVGTGTIDSHNMYAFVQLALIDGDVYLSVEYETYSGGYTQINKNNESLYYTTQGNGGTTSQRFQFYLLLNNFNNGVHNYNFIINNKISSTGIHQYQWIAEPVKNVFKIQNYSKKYGKWVVNFVENKATNIAHDYKMLFELEGNETDGTVTDIDGYNDTYIYFHYGSDYYRVSIQTATNFEDVVTSLNNVYYIFNTVSYLNAYYANGNDWFCSCDDWNDRVLWYVNSDDFYEILTTSRLNNNWQTLIDVTSVSSQIAPILKKIAITPKASTMEAYSVSETWDGVTIVYDSNGVKVDTDEWEYGHSLNGYYYPTVYISVPGSITPVYIDDSYTCPQYQDQNLQSVKQRYDVFFSEEPPRESGEQSLIKQGYLTADGFTVQSDSGNMFSIPDTIYEYQDIPALLDTTFNVYTTSVIINRPSGSYTGLTVAMLGGAWVLVYLNQTEVDPIKVGDSVFIINGIEYTYKAETNRIVDYTGAVVCNTYLMQYIGYSTKCAFFYSLFDNAVYTFVGDNSMQKLTPLENYKPQFRVYNNISEIDTLLISSLNVVIINLDTAFMVLLEDQYVLIECGTINQWAIDESKGTFIVNGIMYSLIKSSLAYGNYLENEINPLPIEITTQLYGDPETEKNLINDCVYLTVDNLQALYNGTVKIQAIGLQNQKIIKAEEKTINLKQEDFNELSQCLIKYQPKLQECRGFKLKITSDFEIAELKIGVAQGAINQTTKRI